MEKMPEAQGASVGVADFAEPSAGKRGMAEQGFYWCNRKE